VNTPGNVGPKLKVFVSYSRADSAFVDELVDGLEYSGFEVTLDRHSIVEGEEWKKRLGALIADADTIVFVLSPDSIAAPICEWEVEEAHRLSKRLLPVLCRPIASGTVPARLAALNYVRFDEGHSFMAGLRALSRALESDIDWLRQQTRLLARAMEWDSGGRPENRLLFGQDIEDAKAWAARRPKDAPEVTPLHLDFIKASALAEAARQSEERKRLEQMAAAAAAREEAVRAAEIATQEKAQASRLVVQRTLAGLVVAIVFAVAAAGAAVYAFKETRIAKTQRDLLAPGPLVESKMGDIDAPIVMIEYSSLTCPHCASYHANTFPKIKEKYIDKGKVLYISREFPLDNLSIGAYMLARCKKTEQSFDIVEALFKNQTDWTSSGGSPADKLFAVVENVGFSHEEFEKCLSDKALLDNLKWVRDRGYTKLGINATPTFFINEAKIVGNQDFKTFEAAFAKYVPIEK
jgi:protein-disulfide isomerase